LSKYALAVLRWQNNPAKRRFCALKRENQDRLEELICNSLNSTLRTALARLHLSDRGNILPHPRLAGRAE